MIEKAKEVGAGVSGGSIIAHLQVFNDPIFFYLAYIGAIVSFFGLLHDILNKKEFMGWKRVIGELIKAVVFGFLITPLIFLVLLHGGNEIISKIWDIDLNMTASVFLIASIMLSWYAIPLLDWAIAKLFKGKENG